MAKQVADLVINLGIQGDQDLSRLSGQFRELGRAVNLSGGQIDNLRQRILSYNSDGQRSEQLIRGQVDALKALQRQAELGGTAWQQINSNIRDLERSARLSNGAIEQLGRTVMAEATAHGQSAASLREHIRSLERLRDQATINSQTTRTLSESIGQLRERLDTASDASRRHFSSLTQALGVRPDAVLRQWQAYRDVLDDSRATAEQLATAQQRLRQLGGAPFISQRRAVAEQAAMVADPEYQRRFGVQADTLNEVPLPNTTAGLTQRLQELQFQLANTERGTAAYVQTALAMATVQRDLSATTQGLGQALIEQLAAGRAASSLRNLRAAVAQLNGEMQELDLTTSEGSAEYARLATQSRQLQQQLDRLARSYTNVADAANRAADAQSSAASRAVTANYLNRAQVRQQEAAFRAAASEALRQAQATPLMLPAAGQTSAPGTGMNISGGARYGYPSPNLAPLVQLPGPVGSTAAERSAAYRQGLAGAGPSAADAAASDAARRAYISETAATRARNEAQQAAALRMTQLEQAAVKLNRTNGDSIEKLRALRQSWTELRDAVQVTSDKYREANRQITAIDRQLVRAEGGRRITGMQIAQAGGAAISGGIFGGIEGFAGGAIGGLIGAGTPAGPVGGAFAGAAIGAQVGMIRQQLGQITADAAQVERLKTALRGVVGTTQDYERAIGAATIASQRFNLTPAETIQGLTRLTASVRGAGGTIRDAEAAYTAVTAAIRATGGSSADAEAAVLALSQIFSKGKVSAEELSGQIGERLPGAVTLFAQATGRTLPQLQKDLEQGTVGLNDLMKFVVAAGDKYTPLMDKLANSTEAAGDRMRVSLANLGKAFGDAFKPIGASVQTAIGQLADLALQAARTLGIVRQAAGAEITVQRGRDIGRRVGEAASAVERRNMSGLIPFSPDPRRVAYERVQSALGAITTQQNIEGTRQNLEALKTLRELQRRIGIGDVPADRAETRQRLLSEQGRVLEQRLREEEARYKALQERERAGLTVFPTPTGKPGEAGGTSETEKGAERAARREADRIRDAALLEVELMKANFEQRTELEEQAHEHAMALAKLRNDYTEEALRRTTRAWISSTVGEDREIRTILAGFRDEMHRIDLGTRDLRLQLATAERAVKVAEEQEKLAQVAAQRQQAAQEQYATSVETAGMTGTAAGAYLQGNIGPTSTGPHLHIARMDSSFFERAALDAYVRINGAATLSAGTTVRGGRFNAPRSYGPHRAWDYAFPEGARMQLTGGAEWLSVNRGTSVGDVAAFRTPDGKVYKVIHGKFEDKAGPLPPGAVADVTPAAGPVVDTIQARTAVLKAKAEVVQLNSVISETEKNAINLRKQVVEQFSLDVTERMRNQTYELERNAQETALRNRLQLEGVRPELIDSELEKARATQRYTAYIRELNTELETLRKTSGEDDPTIKGIQSAIAALEQGLPNVIKGLEDAAAAAIRFNDALRFRQDMRIGEGITEGLNDYIAAMGTAREASKQLALTGIKGVENAIVELATTGTTNFREFANSLIQDTVRVITQQLIMRTVLGLFNLGQPAAVPGLGGESASSFISGTGIKTGVDFSGVRQFAQGGIATGPASGYPAVLHGTEAVIPLSGSRAIPVQMQGTGAAPIININVDATGTAVQGNQSQAQDLARDLAAVVDDRLVYHRRRGGLLDPQR